MKHHRNFGVRSNIIDLPAVRRPVSRGQLIGPTLEARSFIQDDRDFIAGLFAGITLLAGPFAVAVMVLLYL